MRRNEGLCINTTVAQGAYFFPVSKSGPFPFSPVLQFPLALETDICYFQFHNFLILCITAHMAPAFIANINTCGRLHFNHWTLATFFFLMQCNSSGFCHHSQAHDKVSNKINVSQARSTIPPQTLAVCPPPHPSPTHRQMRKLGSVGRIL